MAEEDLALEGDDAQAEAAAAEQEADDTPEAVAKLARDLGWTPREEWQGEPEKWKPAEQFIRDGREIQQSTAKELRAVREQMERLSGVTTQIVTDKVAEARAQWEANLARAVEDGDTETALKLAREEPQPRQPNGPDPTVQSWVAKNPWFNTHPRAASVAREISDKLANQGYDTATQLAEAEAEVKQRYPELFGKPAKPPASTQTGTARHANPSNRIKGFSDMPRESQAVALDYEKRLGVPKEQTAKSYWAEQEGVRR